jgi:hypothetical protein
LKQMERVRDASHPALVPPPATRNILPPIPQAEASLAKTTEKRVGP